MTQTKTTAIAVTIDDVAVNGPEDVDLDWQSIDWRSAEGNVRRLRRRIFTASKAGDLKKVRNLQKLMLRCRSNTLVSVRQVTQRNAGRQTAGIDGVVALSPRARSKLVVDVQRRPKPCAKAVRRVHIPKVNGKQRPLGIPVIFDRVQQARVKNALEPEWEARFEPKSYGFRPGRSCHDAIEAIFKTCGGNGRNARRQWVLDADLTAAFDKIDHKFLLDALGTFPAKDMIAAWLKAGVIESGKFAPTDEGTPQGGVISPLLLNVALHGLEEAAGVRYQRSGSYAGNTMPDAPITVRYADDFVVLCHSRDDALRIRKQLGEWLKPRGLSINEDKTQIVNLSEGFDFLSFNIRRYNDNKLLIKPSKAATKRLRKRLSTEMKNLRGSNVSSVIRTINPIIRGWSCYYRSVVSSKIFSGLDRYMWTLNYKWAKYSHENKPRHWISNQYFGRFNKSRADRWVFGHRESGSYMQKFAWTAIVRHRMVKGDSSPDDPTLADYWARRRRREPLPLMDKPSLRLLKAQDGRCSLCGDFLLHADRQPQSPQEWELWLRGTRKAMYKGAIADRAHGTPDYSSQRLVHAACSASTHNDWARPANF